MWILKYCKLHNFRIRGTDVPMEYTTKDGRVVDNYFFKYTNQSHRVNAVHYRYWDEITRAFNYTKRRSHGQD